MRCSSAMRRGPARADQHAIGQRHRLHQIVRDKHHGLPGLGGKPQQQIVHRELQLRIERSERLVEQRRFGAVQQHAREAGALAHAAGQFVRIAMLEAVEPDMLDHLIGAIGALGLADAGELERKRDVVAHRAPRQQIVLLRHVADVGVDVGDARTLVDDRAAASARRARRSC